MAPFCIVLVAVLCLTLNLTHPAAATDPDDEDSNSDSDEDDTSHENQAQNFTHSLGNRSHSSSRTTTTEEPDEDYPDPDIHVATAHPNLITRLPETGIHTSAGVSSVISFQVFTSTVHQDGRLDFSQTSEPRGQIYSIVIPERSIEGVPDSSTSLGFISGLQPVFSDSPTSVFLSSGFITSEAVAYGTATHKAAHNITLSASFLPSIHDTNFLMSRSSEGTRDLSTTLVFGDFQASFPGTTGYHSASSEFRQGENATRRDHTSSFDQIVSNGNTLVSPSSLEAVNAYFSYVTESYEPRHHSDYDFQHVHRSSLTETIFMAWTANGELTESTVTTEAVAAERTESTAIEQTDSRTTDHSESTVTGHAQSTFTEHTESTATENAQSTFTEHTESTVTEHAESAVTEHVESVTLERSESRTIEQIESTVTEHIRSTITDHTQSSVIEHAQSIFTEHAESTTTDYTESRTIEQTESAVTEHFRSTVTDHIQSIITEHAESIITELRSTVTEHAESTTIERSESTNIQQTESRSIEYIQSTITEHAELASTEQAESALTMPIESASTSTEMGVFPSQSSPQHSPLTLPETPIGFGLGLSTYFTVSSVDVRSDVTDDSRATGGFLLVPSTVSLLYGDFSQAEETAQRESSTDTSSHECPNCSSFGHSLEGITSTIIQAPESNTFPGDLTVETSTFGMSTWFSLTSSHTHAEPPSLVDSAAQTSIHPDGSEVLVASTLSSPQLLSSRDIRESSREQTTTTTSLYDLSEVHLSSNYSSRDTPDSFITSSFYSSLHLNEESRFSSHTVFHIEESMSSSRNDTPSVPDTLLSSVHDIPSIIDSVNTSTYDTFDRSGIITSLGYDRTPPPEAIETSAHDSRHGLEENDTSIYHLVYTTEEMATSGYETLHIDGSLIPASNIFSSHRLQYTPTTPSMDLERSVTTELSETLSEISQSIQPAIYLSSSRPDSSISIGTELLLQTTLTHPRASVPDTITVSSQWESGRSDVGIASLSSTQTSIATAEGALTSGQGLSVITSATTDTSTEQTSLSFTRSFLETSFSLSTDLQQISTSILGDLLTSTTLISSTTTLTTQIATNATTSATTVKAATPQTETSTEVVHKVPSNFTIVIYFNGDCQRAHEKKYTGILNAKMQQLIRNISQIDDKTSVLIGHIKCNPSRIPVSFLHADKPLVFLYLNETFSASLRILRIHSLILNLTGYSEALDAPKQKGEGEITSTDITIFATASCICLVLIIAGVSIFAKEIYHKKFSNRFSCPVSLGMPLKSEAVALRSIPTNKSDYKHVEMSEEAFVNEAYSGPSEDEHSSVASEMKTAFPSSSPEETRVATKTRKQSERNADNASKSIDAASVPLSNGTHRHETPGYGLIIGLMGYTKRLERQQQRKAHQLQQQKQQFEESSYYAVPQKRAKIPKIQDNTKTNASPTPPPYSPASRSVTLEDSPVLPPRLRTLHEVNETFESDEELSPFINTPGTDNAANAISLTDTGLDNPSFLDGRGRVETDSEDVFHF